MRKLFPQHDRAITGAVVDYLMSGGHLGDPSQHDHFRDRFSHLAGLEQRVIITRCKIAVSRLIVGAIRQEMETYHAG
ncbi:hypothetical protein LJR098_001108 [Rhizobium sp. LjRoot98]|uniref:hypothetical protein n=1 Tax=Rhizobium sp. LjRoot98 TaxID=3342345 RepID=UPI003ECC58F2